MARETGKRWGAGVPPGKLGGSGSRPAANWGSAVRAVGWGDFLTDRVGVSRHRVLGDTQGERGQGWSLPATILAPAMTTRAVVAAHVAFPLKYNVLPGVGRTATLFCHL